LGKVAGGGHQLLHRQHCQRHLVFLQRYDCGRQLEFRGLGLQIADPEQFGSVGSLQSINARNTLIDGWQGVDGGTV